MPAIAASPSTEVERYQNTITGTSGRRSGVNPLTSCDFLLVFCNDDNNHRWLSESCAPVRFTHFLTTWQSVKPNTSQGSVPPTETVRRHRPFSVIYHHHPVYGFSEARKYDKHSSSWVASSDGFIPSLAISQCTCLLICCCCVTWQTNSSLSMTVEDCWSLSFQAWNLPFLQILPTAAFPFLLQDWLHDSPDCLLLLLSISVFYVLVFLFYTF